MSDHSISPDNLSSQLPDGITELIFEGDIRCVIIEGTPFWSVLDTYKVYGKSGNPRRDWSRDRKELKKQGFDETASFLVPYVFVGSDGKNKVATPMANLEGFMRIAQVAKFKEWEPLRAKMAQLMANSIRRFVRQDPQWEQTYRTERITHMQLMDALEEAVWFICQGYHYKEAAETVFLGLYKRSVSQLMDEMQLKSGLVPIEHYQTVLALSYQTIAKELARERLGERTELDFDEAKTIIYDAAALIAPQVEAVSKARGRDVATNKPLLTDGR